jgi:predicted nucleic acid-binding protein
VSIVLDSGALIALERNDKRMWTVLKLAALESEDVLVPTSALAQVWRGTARQARLASALEWCVLASFDAVARGVGELCGRARTKDVVDAQVAIVAATRGEVLYTSDPSDMKRLVAACRAGTPSIVRC